MNLQNPNLMKYLILAVTALSFPVVVFCQDITGLWTGTLYNDSTQQSLPYEIFIRKDKGKYSGFSQTWVLVDEKKYYAIKKINIRIAKDGKVIIQDAALTENNYPSSPDKNVIQLNVLNVVNEDNETSLNGVFVTNRSKYYRELTGRIDLKRTSVSIAGGLMQYVQKNGSGAEITAAK